MKSLHRRRSALFTWVLVLALAGTAALARRTPAPGGDVTVALPADMVEKFIEAHRTIPLIERVHAMDARSLVFERPLAGASGWRSAILTRVTSRDRAQEWALESDLPAKLVEAVVKRCLDTSDSAAGWPAQVIRATGIQAEVTLERSTVRVRFSNSFGPFVELLAGCLVHEAALAPYALVSGRALEAQQTALEGVPALTRIELRPDGETGQLVVGGESVAGYGTLVAPYADMLLLVQIEPLLAKDLLRLAPPDGSLLTFHAELRPDLLVATYWAGRGRPTIGILPPGLAPARPLPDTPMTARPLPLTLAPLDEAAERIIVHRAADDALVGGVVDRLAVLLRTRGYGLKTVPLARVSSGLSVVRWRPDSDDPALALLAFAGQHASLHDDAGRRLLADPRLLSSDFDERMSGAIALERSWVESRRVVPLLLAELHYTVDIALKGVRIRPDGIPVFDDAYWSGAR
jgi:hypothetical protein